ncbi:MAG: nitrate- and nitrite sensing domain-containing protein [Streptomycetales bacterium]
MLGIRQRTTHRFGRRPSLRTSLTLLALVPGLALAGLGGYAATALVGQGLQLRADTRLARSVGVSAQEVLVNLQEERRLTAVWQAAPASSRTALESRRRQTDAAVLEYGRQADAALDSAGAQVIGQAHTLQGALESLSQQRAAVDSQTISRDAASRYYTEIFIRGSRLHQALSRTAGGRIAEGTAAVASLAQTTEMISREDALLSAAVASERMSPATRREFAGYVAAQRLVGGVALPGNLPGRDARVYDRITASPQWAEMVSIEDSVVTGGSALPARTDEWRAAVDRTGADLRELGRRSFDAALDDSTALANGLLLRAFLGSAVALLALALSGVLVVRFWGSLLRRLSRLHDSIRQADTRLPEIAAQLERGEEVDLAGETQEADYGTDEFARVAAAVAALERTAESTVVQQAQGREANTKILVNLARRTQILVHREISMLDAMERTYEDAELLEKLFAVDHTATRVRRHAENLLLLGGSLVPRGGDGATPLVEVLRSAVSETEDYVRVTVGTHLPRVSLEGPASTDVIHLVAELVENGTSFSPPHTKVEVRAEEVPNGLVIEVEDRGLGMKPSDYQNHNQQLADPPAPEMLLRGEDARLGLFVVARLAQRHGIEVSLCRSRYGGTCAIVLLPKTLLKKARSVLGIPGLPAGARVVTSAGGAGAARQEPAPARGGSVSTDGPRAVPDPPSSTVPAAAESAAGEPEPSSPDAGDGHTELAEGAVSGHVSPQTPVTGRGFPKRVRGTNLPRQLQEPATSPRPGKDTDEPSPEQISTVTAAIQLGTRRAQAAAPADDQNLLAGTPGQGVPGLLPKTKDDSDADEDPGR